MADNSRRPKLHLQAVQQGRLLLQFVAPEVTQENMLVLGRVLLHAALVGVACGIVGAALFAALEYGQRLLLEELAGYVPLRSVGEAFAAGDESVAFRPWLLVFLPAVGALLAGAVTRWAPETRGGGGNAALTAYHTGTPIRARAIGIKFLASVFTLASGGSGGREGPTMQMGGGLGCAVARLLKVSAAEQRVLLVAGIAAGISAVFRTPLGAALLAVEFLYRDDMDTEALVPAVLASVISYSVVTSIYGEATLFGRLPAHPFHPQHLPLYVIMAVLVSVAAVAFVRTLRAVEHRSAAWNLPGWAKPAVGGAALGLTVVPALVLLGDRMGRPGSGLGLLGGSYGAAQLAITGGPWLDGTWGDVRLLLLLCAGKLVATSLTIGTGGSAGDFAPSMIMGALVGGAFGRAAQLALGDPTIQPAAFALVGMGTFYGGIAHVPISAVILVSEMAGSYDLLVPLMFSVGVAFVMLRRFSLYEAQPEGRRKPGGTTSTRIPVAKPNPLRTMKVGDVMARERPWLSFEPATAGAQVVRRALDAPWQDAFPVLNAEGRLVGMIRGEALRVVAASTDLQDVAVAADLMEPPISVTEADDLQTAAERMLKQGVREVLVVADGTVVVGMLDEADLFRAYLRASDASISVTPPPFPAMRHPPG